MVCFEIGKDLLKVIVFRAEMLFEMVSADWDWRLVEDLFFEIV